MLLRAMSFSSDALSPTPSSPTHTALEIPQDIYYDPRTLPGPSLYVKAVINHAGNGSFLARSADGLHCAVACKDSAYSDTWTMISPLTCFSTDLKVLKINDLRSLPLSGANEAGRTSRRAKLLGKGPEGATIHEETTIRMTQNTQITDVGWGHGSRLLRSPWER